MPVGPPPRGVAAPEVSRLSALLGPQEACSLRQSAAARRLALRPNWAGSSPRLWELYPRPAFPGLSSRCPRRRLRSEGRRE